MQILLGNPDLNSNGHLKKHNNLTADETPKIN